jgi:hypothetical protein
MMWMGNAAGMGDLTAELLALPLRVAAWGVCRVAERPPAGAGYGAAGGGWGRASTAGNGLNMGRGIVDWMIGGLAQQVTGPADSARSMVEGVLRWPEMVRLVVPGRASRAAWAEFRNKADAFRWFATAGSKLGLRADRESDLGAALRRVELMDSFQGLWTTEGLGYHQAAAALRDGGQPRSLLAGPASDALPARSLVPLHTGMGLAFAGHCLNGCVAESRGADLRRQLELFVTLCHDNARDDYWAASLEALGLSTRLLRPRLVLLLDGQLRQMGDDLVHCFWHGVGRGLYFGPATALPCGTVLWPTAHQAYSEPPREEDRRNALAGLALALTLVNVRHPEVIEWYLESDSGHRAAGDAFASGVGAALRIWSSWAPVGGYTDLLLRHRPAAGAAGSVGRWGRLVRAPLREALRYGQRVAESNDWPGGLFSYRPHRERARGNGSGRE